MPELPEVETVRRGLQAVAEGARIVRAEQRRPDLRFALPQDFAARLSGKQIVSLGRRAKYLLFNLDDGLTMIAHLGMSGSWRIEGGAHADVPGAFQYARSRDMAHDHVLLHLRGANGQDASIVYNDPRRFGFLLFAEPGQLDGHPSIATLGIEPTGNELGGDAVSRLFAGKAAPLKAALLDQRLIAGLGNIYVCEALWRSGLSPRRKAGTIGGARAHRLAGAVRSVIAEAIAAGGSSLRDYMSANGELGYFQHSFSVYDREGEPCPKDGCAGTIRRIVQSGRSTFFCPRCQL